MGGTGARWRSSSAPTSRTRHVSRSRVRPSSPRLLPSNEAELPAGPGAVRAVGVISGAAGGAGTEDRHVVDSRRDEEKTGGHAQIEVRAPVAVAPCRLGRVGRSRAQRVPDLRADLVAAPPDRG